MTPEKVRKSLRAGLESKTRRKLTPPDRMYCRVKPPITRDCLDGQVYADLPCGGGEQWEQKKELAEQR